MELRHLRYFVTIAGLSNFTKAAERLHITQPALSRQMRDLEDEAGCNLFDRVNNGVRLTAKGRQFLAGARKVLAASESLLSNARGHPEGKCPPLRITHFGTLSAQICSPFLRKLARRHPGLKLIVEEELPGVAIRELRAGRLDAVLSGEPEPQVMKGLESRVVWITPHDVFLPANHRLAKRRSISLRELRDENWAVWDERQFPGFGRHVVKCFRRCGWRPKISARVDSLASLFIHVAEGDFISHVPVVARKLPHPGAVCIPVDPPDALNLDVLLLWRPDTPHRAELEWLAETMAATLPGKCASAANCGRC